MYKLMVEGAPDILNRLLLFAVPHLDIQEQPATFCRERNCPVGSMGVDTFIRETLFHFLNSSTWIAGKGHKEAQVVETVFCTIPLKSDRVYALCFECLF